MSDEANIIVIFAGLCVLAIIGYCLLYKSIRDARRIKP